VGPAVNKDPGRYEKVSKYDKTEMSSKLKKFVDAFESGVVSAVAYKLVELLGEHFLMKPAATGMHHAFKHGLLEHTTQMLETADKLFELPFYAEALNKDLCMFGIMFHDAGKIYEYGDGPGYKKTVSGMKVPHIPKMAAIIYHACQELKVEDEICDELMSIVLSHHRMVAWGSPVGPSSPEALFVHYVDNLHGDVFGVLQRIESDTSAEPSVKHGYGDQAYTIVKKRFSTILKELGHDGKDGHPEVERSGITEGQEVDLGGF
jgi:3'-5' exoribonuclease